MRIVTWNINSIRIRLPLLQEVANILSPDIICLQETKVQDAEFPHQEVADIGYPHMLIRGQKSYNGVAILSRNKLKEGETRDWCGRSDCRHISAKLPGGVELHNFYVPAGGDTPDPEENDKFAHKLAFIEEMADWSASLNRKKRILVGDLNIAPLETDVWSHKQLLKVVSHTPVEVDGLNNVRDRHNWIDAIRHFVPTEDHIYSWWSYRNRTWPGSDKGRRLDHVWVSPSLGKNLRAALIAREVRGWEKPSDHAPVMIDIEL